MADNTAKIILTAEDRTRGAFASVRGNLDSLQGSAAAAITRFTAIGAAITAGIGLIRLQGITETLDQLDDLSEKSGITVERLSALRFAGEAVGTPLEDIATSSRKLAVNMAAAAGGSKEAASAFAAIGVSVTDTTGKLRSTDEVLLDVADKFAGYKDGAGKAALAQEIFGKSGERLIPLLNQGREGISRLTREAEQLGAVYGGDLAKRAADLNDNLAKLKLAAEALTTNALGPLIANLAKLSGEMLESIKTGDKFTLMVQNLLDLLSGKAQRKLFLGREALFEEGDVAKFENDAERIRVAIGKLSARPDAKTEGSLGNQLLKSQIAQLAEVEAKIAAAGASSANAARSALRKAEGGITFARDLKDAPVIKQPGSATADADKELRQQLAARVAALNDGLAAERDALAFHERYLSQVYDAGLLTVQQFYDERSQAQRQALTAQLQAFEAEAAALAKARDQAKTPEVKADIFNRINDLTRDRANLEAKAAQAGVLADGERSKALAGLQSQLEDYRLQLLELRGDEAEADRVRAQRQVEQFNRVSQNLGAPVSERADFAKAVGESVQLANARRDLTKITDAARQAEELYLAKAEATGTGQLEAERGVYALRQQSIAQLEELVARVNELAAASSNPALTAYAKELGVQLARAKSAVEPATRQLYEAADQIGVAFASSFERAIVSGARLSDVFKSIGNDITAIVTRLLVTQPLAEAISKSIKSFGSGGGGIEGIFGNIASAIFGGGKAAGGPVRSGGLYQVAENGPELLQMGSRAYLLMGDQGGRVQPTGTSMAVGQAVSVVNHFNISGAADLRTQEQIAVRVGRAARQAMARGTA